MRKILIAIVLAGVVFTGACATVKGIGKDIKSVGEAGQKAID